MLAFIVLAVVCLLAALGVYFQDKHERDMGALVRGLPGKPPVLSHEIFDRRALDVEDAAEITRRTAGELRSMHSNFYAEPECPKLKRWLRTTLMSIRKVHYEAWAVRMDFPKKDRNNPAIIAKAMAPYFKQLRDLMRRSEQEIAGCSSLWYTGPDGGRDNARTTLYLYGLTLKRGVPL